MDIIISGYGKMGKEVERICLKRNHNILAIINTTEEWNKLSLINYSNAVVIDFSLPEVAINNIIRCFEHDIPIITGTTGWHNQIEYVSDECKKNNGTLFYAPNFSIGVNILLKVNSYLAKLMSHYNNYKVHINETHHIHKLDAPSGTAIAVADGIINEYPNLTDWSLDASKNTQSLSIFSNREGEVTGTHEIIYESAEDKITLVHEAKNRSGFAMGAVLAAEFIKGKYGIYSMNDLINQSL